MWGQLSHTPAIPSSTYIYLLSHTRETSLLDYIYQVYLCTWDS